MVYHRILNIIPCTVLYSCLGNPEAPSRLQSMGSQKSWTQQQLSNNYIVGRCLSNLYTPVCICSPTLQVQLSPTPLPLGSYQSVLYVPDSASEMLQAHLCCMLDSAYKWYHMEFVFLVLIYLVCSSLIVLLYSRGWHNIVNQIYFHWKKNFFLKKRVSCGPPLGEAHGQCSPAWVLVPRLGGPQKYSVTLPSTTWLLLLCDAAWPGAAQTGSLQEGRPSGPSWGWHSAWVSVTGLDTPGALEGCWDKH